MKKIISYIAKIIKYIGIGGFLIFSAGFTVFFLRLLAGPIDITWVKSYVEVPSYIKKVDQASISLENTTLQFQLDFTVETPKKTQLSLQANFVPLWLYLLSGELRFKAIGLEAHKLDLRDFNASQGIKDSDEKGEQNKYLQDDILKTIKSTLSKVAVPNITKFSFFAQNAIVSGLFSDNHPLHIKNVAFSLEYQSKATDAICIAFSLDRSLILEGDYFFSDGSIRVQDIKGSIEVRKEAVNIIVSDLSVGEVQFKASSIIDIIPDQLTVSSKVSSKATIDSETLKCLWPKIAATGARDWVSENLKKALVQDLKGDFYFIIDNKGVVLDTKVKGSFNLKDGEISYLGELPNIQEIAAGASFSEKEMKFLIKEAYVNTAKIESGSVLINGFEKTRQTIEIDINLNGQVPNVLEILNRKPLQYIEKTGLQISQISGEITSKIFLQFPLLKDLFLADVKMDITGKIKALEILKLPEKLPYDLKEATLDYTVTQKEMSMNGKGVVSGQSVLIDWYSNFETSKDLENQLTLQGKVPLSIAKPFVDLQEFISSNISTKFKLIYRDYVHQSSILEFLVDTQTLEINFPWIFFQKKQGKKASLAGEVVLPKNKPMFLRNISLLGDEKSFYFKGGVEFDKEERLSAITVTGAEYEGNIINRAEIEFLEEGGIAINVDAKSFDFLPYWRKYLVEDEELKNDSSTENSIIVNFKSNNVLMNDAKFPLGETEVYLSIEDNQLLALDVFSQFLNSEKIEKQGSVKVIYRGKGAIEEEKVSDFSAKKAQDNILYGTCEVNATEVGYLLNALGLLDNIKSGSLKLDMHLLKEKGWSGKLNLSSFTILDAPFVARFISIVSLAGIPNILDRESGLIFSSLDADFAYENKVLDISKLIAYSPSIGISTKGKIRFMPKKLIEMTGTFSPLNLLNSFISYIPIIGDIIGGGKGEGIFSFTFSVKGELANPEVNVNPISILAPGILRNIFTE